jgi:hypothetical protein
MFMTIELVPFGAGVCVFYAAIWMIIYGSTKFKFCFPFSMITTSPGVMSWRRTINSCVPICLLEEICPKALMQRSTEDQELFYDVATRSQ